MQANHYKTHQDFSNEEHTNVSNLASSAARDQTKVGSTLLASLSYEDIENIHAPELNGSIDTKEVLLSVDGLKNASKELNNWETLTISIPDNKDSNRTILFNLRGKKHKIRASHFEAFPETRLGILVKATDVGEILELCDHFYPGQPPEYYFDRNSSSFNAILDIYRTGLLHLSSDMCALVLQKELEFWRIDELTIEPCCALKYYPEIEQAVKEQKGEEENKKKEVQRQADENFGDSRMGKIRTLVWNLMEYPETSRTAQIFAWASLGMVLVSTFTFILGTLPEFQKESETGKQPPYPEAVLVMETVENIVVLFFFVEYCVRFICSPRKFHFFKQPMNLVDFCAIVPFFLDLVISGMQDIEIMGKAGKIVRLVRVMRVMRIFKLVRYFAGLQSLMFTLNQAYKELGLLMLLVGVCVLTFASMVYFAEKDNPAGSWSFLDSIWWGLMTLTTVGYGELAPASFTGKLMGGLCALCGIFFLTLPLPIVVNSFAGYYKNQMWRNEVNFKKREQAQKRKEMEDLTIKSDCLSGESPLSPSSPSTPSTSPSWSTSVSMTPSSPISVSPSSSVSMSPTANLSTPIH